MTGEFSHHSISVRFAKSLDCITYVTDMIEDRSECVIYDARKLADGPVARIILPGRISSGTHATWEQGETIRASKAAQASRAAA